MLKWYKEPAKNSDVVISSRIRLARNLRKYPFSIKLSDEQAVLMVNEVKESAKTIEQQTERKYNSSNVNTLAEIDKTAMVERHIISPLLTAKEQSTGLILSEDEKISIMINEEDHLRIQSVTGGMNIYEAFRMANKVDDITSGIFEYAFHEKYGYLTSCPTNVGTGLRASYMVFLPALTAAGRVGKLIEELGKYGIALRGTYGEATKSVGSLYSYDEVEDKVHRSYGILRYARQLTSGDAMTLLAQLKLGLDLELIKPKQEFNVHELMMDIQPGNLQCHQDKNIGSIQRDKIRADYIREKLPEII
ncbi:MAG: putative ATP:guanido phosphotransferase Hore [Anaerocolumna sp.]|nr:putative ATP:guanido phosphotransferase Hore [Anaerocolumna sp.]